MSLNRTAKGIVLVPSLLLGAAFLAAAAWTDGASTANRPVALALGLALMGAGLLAQLLPEGSPETELSDQPDD
jgi:hypothetical protein